jgi:Mg2+-importing ATPase
MRRRIPEAFWSVPVEDLLEKLQTSPRGLTAEEAGRRLEWPGARIPGGREKFSALRLLASQFKSPILLLLLLAAGLSFFLRDAADALIILGIILVSGLLGFWQEKGAFQAVDKLLALVKVKTSVFRDGEIKEVDAEGVVPGDVVSFSAGDVIPGDCRLLEAKDLFLDEAPLTGETYPVEKDAGVTSPTAPLRERSNVLFMGTHVVSGRGKAAVVYTGRGTEFGKVSERLKLRPPETEFERGVRRFGYLLMEVTLILVIAIFAINVYFARPVLEAFLFSLALAVGLTPQLLPAIVAINLAHGAKRMAREKVIVKRLVAIENFGAMNVLCADKTGTLTEGVVRLESALSTEGEPSEEVLLYAYLNAFYETGFVNPVDEAIRQHRFDVSAFSKLDEVPYDFIRKRLSILASHGETHLMITKGALPSVLGICTRAQTSGKRTVEIALLQEEIRQRYEKLSQEGFRVLGVAFRDMGLTASIQKEAEVDLTFLGFLVLKDPPKPQIGNIITRLGEMGICLKIITGDNRFTASQIGAHTGLSHSPILTGEELRVMSDEALAKRVGEVDIFAEVEPNQKERIIRSLRKRGEVVGFMGDGINDASALHAADVGISVDRAVDVAKEAADIVLLEKDLEVLVHGVREGRTTFANTLKYVFMASSANFGNMFSMAGASLFLPFLPMLPKQILLTNLLTDFPEMTIATDRVDREWVEKPRRWDIRFIRNFMIVFGAISSLFDYLTFGILLWILRTDMDQFRTGWFLESVISAALIVLVVRTRRPFLESRPGKSLFLAIVLVASGTALFPYTPLAGPFGFRPLPLFFFSAMGMIVALYMIAAEMAKGYFYRKVKF